MITRYYFIALITLPFLLQRTQISQKLDAYKLTNHPTNQLIKCVHPTLFKACVLNWESSLIFPTLVVIEH